MLLSITMVSGWGIASSIFLKAGTVGLIRLDVSQPLTVKPRFSKPGIHRPYGLCSNVANGHFCHLLQFIHSRMPAHIQAMTERVLKLDVNAGRLRPLYMVFLATFMST